jgi:hypothetical protein
MVQFELRAGGERGYGFEVTGEGTIARENKVFVENIVIDLYHSFGERGARKSAENCALCRLVEGGGK